MIDIAEKFKSIGQETVKSSSRSSSLMGDTNLISQVDVKQNRIGFYPILSEQYPEIAMGIASCLAYLIEQYGDLRVYRIFAQIDANDEDTELSSNDYQFSMNDWEFTGLDDNIILAGSLKQDKSSIELQIHLDFSMVEELEDTNLTFRYKNLVDLVSNLPNIASKIAEKVNNTSPFELIITYPECDATGGDLKDILEDVFFWNLDLYLFLWNVEWSDEEILEQFNEMVNRCVKLESVFASWCTAMMAKQVMQVGLDVIGDVLVPELDGLTTLNSITDIPSATLSMSLANLGYGAKAINLVEQVSVTPDTDVTFWLAKIGVYLKSNNLAKAIDTNQLAIEFGNENIQLYWLYHQLLSTAEHNDLFVEALLFVDPDQVDEEDEITYEIIETLLRATKLEPDNPVILHRLVIHLIEVEHKELWSYFENLLDSSIDSYQVRDIIERFYDLYNIEPAFGILQSQIEIHPDLPEPLIYMAQLYLLDNQLDIAKQYLDKANKMEDLTSDIETEIQRLSLSVQLDNFESKYADILVLLNAGGNIKEDSIEMLESAIEIAPKFADIYVTLARCYLGWNDVDTAQEVLKDAKTSMGIHPRIAELEAQILLRTGNSSEALDILNQALIQHANDIPILTMIAQILIQNKQIKDSKPYIERAEIIAPSHPAIWKLRRLIADSLK